MAPACVAFIQVVNLNKYCMYCIVNTVEFSPVVNMNEYKYNQSRAAVGDDPYVDR